MNLFLSILLSTFIISLGSLVGIFTLAVNQKKLEKVLLLFVSLSAGALMGGAFLHLLPESVEVLGNQAPFMITLFSFTLFFFIEKFFHWHHCHKPHCEKRALGHMNLLGDSIHNFIDGLVMAGAFAVSPSLGIATTLAVALHEIPQEIGDFGVLLYAGWEKKKALLFNFLVALTIVLGGVIGYFLALTDQLISYLTPFAAGGFLYIAASDLLPEIKKETSIKKSFASLFIFVLGIFIMYSLKLIG